MLHITFVHLRYFKTNPKFEKEKRVPWIILTHGNIRIVITLSAR